MPRTTRAQTRTIYSSPEGGSVRRTVLPGGLRVVSETIPGALSASVGIWVGVGSVDETPRESGAAHYLEHLLFKGTKRRSGMEISSAIDAVGGELNAFTGKESTCYYATVLATDLPLAVDLLSDVVLGATLSHDDIQSERLVVLEELAMRDDDPSDLVHDVFAQSMFGTRPVGRPIIGDAAHLRTIERAQIASLYRKHYRPENMVVAVAGKIDHAQVVRLVRKAFRDVLAEAKPRSVRRETRPAVTRPSSAVTVINRRSEQAHLVYGVAGIDRFDSRRFALSVLESAIGGGMSSRLFQEVRERQALAYAVYSFSSMFAGDGMVGVYAGTAPANAKKVVGLVQEAFAAVAEDGLADEEIARAKGQLCGSLVLSMQDSSSRMSRLGRSELGYGDHRDLPWVLEQLQSVTAEDVAQLAGELLTRPAALAVVGPFRHGAFDDVMS
ncbi:pitrilysin family protein [Blastococcus sp. Marseille-P5729]|uniref:M16 family metallopeptidase n=1 Tax=Blastococcus sp. Marseille-P5729 TaxID=2086582 RepID=UPI000D10E601|nr:pitrilysin family protein [Blastococcus sp. Marseille-P5729]